MAKLVASVLKLPGEDLLLFITVLCYLTAGGVAEENQSLLAPVVPVLMHIVRHCMRAILKAESKGSSSAGVAGVSDNTGNTGNSGNNTVNETANNTTNATQTLVTDSANPYTRDTLYNVLYVLEGMCFFNDVMVPVGPPSCPHSQSFLSHGVYTTLAAFVYHPIFSKDRTAFSYAVNIITYSVLRAREKNVLLRSPPHA